MYSIRASFRITGILLVLIISLFSAQTIRLKVTAEQANIRQRPDIGATLLRQLPQGAILESEGREGEWYKVRFAGEDGQPQSGYVHQSLVARLVEPAPVERAPDLQAESDPPPVTPPGKPTPARPTPDDEARSSGSSRRLYAVELSAGFGYIAGGDINRAIRGLADYYQARFGRPFDGRVGSTRLGPALCFAFDYWPNPRAGIGIAVDSVYAGDEVMLGYPGGAEEAGLEIVPEIDSIPVRVHFAFAPAGALVVKAGVEYHFARCRYVYRLTEGAARTEWTGSARDGGLGYYASASLDRRIAGPVSVFAEAAARYARFSGFDGEATHTASDGTLSGEEGPLYFFLEKAGDAETAALLFVRARRPSGAEVLAARRARIDYSGVALRAGLRVRF